MDQGKVCHSYTFCFTTDLEVCNGIYYTRNIA